MNGEMILDKNGLSIDVGNIVKFKGKEYVVNGWDCGDVEIIELGKLEVREGNEIELGVYDGKEGWSMSLKEVREVNGEKVELI